VQQFNSHEGFIFHQVDGETFMAFFMLDGDLLKKGEEE